MIALTAAQIAEAVSGELNDAATPTAQLDGPVVVDSRLAQRGSVFVALPGAHHDGHDFVAVAFAQGAQLAIVTKPVDAPAVVVDDAQIALGRLARFVLSRLAQVRVIAITGSAGKTTTKDLISQVIAPHAPTIAPPGSFNNEIGLPLTVLRADETTRYLVLEMGAAGSGHLAYLTEIAPPDIAVVLGVGQAHLGQFGSVDLVARAKSELVTGARPTAIIVLNGEDHRVAAMANMADGRTVRFFGSGPNSDYRWSDVSVTPAGAAHFTLRHAAASERIEMQLIGEHQVANAAAAAAVGLELGIDLATVAQRLSSARALSKNRMEVTTRQDGVTIINDAYNANPESMAAALSTLARIGSGRRKWAVLGEMRELGAATAAAHARVGEIAAREGVDRLLAVGEVAAEIAAAGLRHGRDKADYRFVSDATRAKEVLAAELTAGDVVLVKASNGTQLWRLGDELARENREE
ncbi:MAG TPA: UDP-N-acetylmuramoyl-tripeptide--D-alanyl-D-alanine ligase [Actinomycetales bacterium]|nr:UDP-N-acetylmuramoyl-tripeptide--D-alanyl-D-alanine ligase [Actinomycetales bacterium]